MSPTRPDISSFIAQDVARQQLISQASTPERRNRSLSPDSDAPDLGNPLQLSVVGAGPSNNAPRLGEKRRADHDLMVTAQRASQRLKLGKTSTKTLLRYAEQPSAEREMYIIAHLLSVGDQLSKMQPARARYQVPDPVWSKIERYSWDILLCPLISAYLKPTIKILTDILLRHPTWGYTREVNEDASKQKVVTTRIQTRLSDRRNTIKSVIGQSIGTQNAVESDTRRTDSTHIVSLIETILAKIQGPASDDTKVTVQMCVRFAFLRQIYRENSDSKYWDCVDDALSDIRLQFQGQAPETLSSYMSSILQRDLQVYGQVDLDAIASETPSDVQAEVGHFATGTVAELDAPDDVEDVEEL